MKKLLQNWISEQAQRRPEAIAVVMEEQTLTYGQLDYASNRLARLLKAAGCEKATAFVSRSPNLLRPSLQSLASSKLIACTCRSTAAVLRRVLPKFCDRSQPRYLLGVSGSLSLLEELFLQPEIAASVKVGWMEDSAPAAKNFTATFTAKDTQSHSGEALEYANQSSDPAHILFTSGSTGDPKGVVITHANVIAFVEWATQYFGMNASDRVSCHPPLHFDLATFDIFGAFAVGAQLHLVPPMLTLLPNKLAEFIRHAELTQWFSVPSVLNYMAKFDVVKPDDFPSLERLLWCGEVFPTPALIYWMQRLPHVTFTNLYGPTETTIASSYYTIPACPVDASQPIPIGMACSGEELMVLDQQLHPLAQGEVGDLYIGGVGLQSGILAKRRRHEFGIFFRERPRTDLPHRRSGQSLRRWLGSLCWTRRYADQEPRLSHRAG